MFSELSFTSVRERVAIQNLRYESYFVLQGKERANKTDFYMKCTRELVLKRRQKTSREWRIEF